MELQYYINRTVDPEEVAILYADAGLNRPTSDIPRIAAMLRHANFIVSARDADKLVGLSRSLTDFRYCCYLSDLAVARSYQRMGIGKELVSLTRKQLGEEVMVLLLAAPQASEYYGPLGFEHLSNAWMIQRSK